MDDDPKLAFADRRAWERWLAANHDKAAGIWVELGKAASKIRSLTRDEALEVALCYGWIDGQARSIDERRWIQRFTPRRARSKWSKINRDKATALIAAGRMKPAGLREVERAKADGRWDAAYDSPRTSTVPPDLETALERNPEARARFAELDAANRYAFLYRIQNAKRPETRARWIEKVIAMLAAGKKFHER